MERWEYRVVSVSDGRYTSMLNEYGAEGWELVTVAHDVRTTPEAPAGGGGLPMPSSFGKFSRAASKIGDLEKRETDAPQPGTLTTKLLWVLRRPVEEEWHEADWTQADDES